MIIAFDIETIPNERMIDRLPAPSVALGNLKDPAKIEAKRAEAKQKQQDSMGLDPLYGRVFCIGIAKDDGKSFCSRIQEDSDEAESTVIQHFFGLFNSDTLTFTSWNGNGFDLPFIFKRAAILGICPEAWNVPALSQFTKRGSKIHIDLMALWAGYNQFQKLDDVSRVMFEDQGKLEIDFKEFLPALKSGDEAKLTEIEDYCKRDCELTLAIFERMQGILF
ncbi:MAG: ribonuclease H-like domain-containing protein [Verrucomicrobiota bacterium]